MTEYTMIDLDEEYDSFEPDIESLIYFANHKNEFAFKKIVELTNRVQELESKTYIFPSLTKEQLNKVEHDYKINSYRNIEA